jgi:hypothetical protein
MIRSDGYVRPQPHLDSILVTPRPEEAGARANLWRPRPELGTLATSQPTRQTARTHLAAADISIFF